MSETVIPVIEQPVRPKARVVKRKRAKRVMQKRTAADVGMQGVHANPSVAHAAPVREDDHYPDARLSRDARSVGEFDIPAHRRKPGIDYQWYAHRVLNEPVDRHELVKAREGGWVPERYKDWPELGGPGVDPQAQVERGGQFLYGRKMHLTLRARQEDQEAANRQLRDRVEGSLTGQVAGQSGLSDIRGVRAIPLQLDIEGEAGAFKR